MHIHSGDPMVPVCGVIVNSPVSITAGGVDGDFILSAAHIAAASLLLYGMQNMEELVTLSASEYPEWNFPAQRQPDKTGCRGKWISLAVPWSPCRGCKP